MNPTKCCIGYYIRVCTLLFVVVFVACCTGTVKTTPARPFETINIPSDYNAYQESDSGVEIQNVTTFLNYWNGRMHWELSQKQISEYSIQAENQILKNLTTEDGRWFHIKNLTRFDEEIGTIIGLSDTQILAFINEDRKQLEIDHMNYEKIYTPYTTVPSVLKNSQSVPYGNEQNLVITPQK